MVFQRERYNLYQSQLRRDIQEKVYGKPVFTVEIFGKEWFGLIKPKKVGPITLQRCQIMGIELPDDKEYAKSEILRIKKEFGQKRGNISFQFGFMNEIISFENCGPRPPEFAGNMRTMRLNIRKQICDDYGLKVAFRENMPQSGIIYDITKSDEELLSEMNSGSKERVKKAIKQNVQFTIATPDQYDLFYQKWCELSGLKGFNPVSKPQFDNLVRYLTQNNRGNLFISEYEGNIVAGSVCMYDEHRLIYLYGFADRNAKNLGGQHFLKWKIFGRARKYGYTYCDMMGGAPTGFPDHPLTSVSLFKESLGGTKIEYYGNYDLVLNSFLYKAFNFYTKSRH